MSSASTCTLVEFALCLVIRRDGEIGLHPKAQDGLRTALDALFRSSRRNAAQELEELLRLASVFEGEGALVVCDAIIDAIAEDGRALIALRIQSPVARAIQEKLAEFEDAPARCAPLHDSGAPTGSIKLSALLEPGRDLRRIQQRNVRIMRRVVDAWR